MKRLLLAVILLTPSAFGQIPTSGNSPAYTGTVSYLGGCDGVTDITAPLNTALTNLNSAGGGTLVVSGHCIVLGQINLPYGAATTYVMSPIRITGATSSRGFSDHPVAPEPGSAAILDLQYNGNRIQSFGQGTLEIDHLTLQNTGSNCGAFLVTTHTNALIHDNTFFGAFTGASACEDVWIAGGSNTPGDGWTMTAADYFQGYGSYMVGNFADQIRRLLYAGVAFNGITVASNVVGNRSGSNLTASITAATNASAAVLTGGAVGLAAGATFKLSISGFTGNWTPCNGNFTATVVSSTTYSIPCNSTSFGAMTGTPVYFDGAAIEIDGHSDPTDGDAGNVIANNLFEMQHYAYGAKLATAGGMNVGQGNTLLGNECFDATDGPVGVACYRFESDSGHNFLQAAYYNAIALLDDVNGTNHTPVIGGESLTVPVPGVYALPGITAAGILGATTGVYWDATHTRFGIANGNPRYPADMQCGSANPNCYFGFLSTGGVNGIYYGQDSGGNGYVWLRDNHTLFLGTNDTTAVQINGNHSVEVKSTLQVDSGGSANKAICWKSGTTLGSCSTQPDSTGSCTCN